MKYIRKQIKELTVNVSKNMLTIQHFHPVPNSTKNSTNKKEYGSLASMMLQQVE
jgi:hypothetical protein